MVADVERRGYALERSPSLDLAALLALQGELGRLKGEALEMVQNFEDSKGRRMVRVKFRLTAVRQGTRVSQEVDIGRSGVSLLGRTLIVVLHKLGKAEEVSPLEKLKLLIEGLSDKSAEIPA